MEFVFVAPVLCTLLIAVIFLRHHLDYMQDSISNIYQRTWVKVLPGNVASLDASETAVSDEGGFGLGISARLAVLGAPATSGAANAVALMCYPPTPYDRMSLPRQNQILPDDNYMQNNYVTPMIPENWGRTLSLLGVFFGDRMGGGVYNAPEGFTNIGYAERFPEIAHPWQRTLNSIDGPEVIGNPFSSVTFWTLDGMTLDRTTTFSGRITKTDKTDGEIRSASAESKNQLETISGKANVWEVIQ